MFRFGFLWRFLLALLLLGLLVAGGSALYRAGFAQGYQAAALAANSSGSTGTPGLPVQGYYPYPYFWPGYGYPGFFPFGPLLGIGFFLLVFFLIGGLFRGFAGRHWAGHTGHGDWGHGPEGSWAREWRERHGMPSKPEESAGETPAEN
jgi:hypothetical protein